jgi:hypothetical protein
MPCCCEYDGATAIVKGFGDNDSNFPCNFTTTCWPGLALYKSVELKFPDTIPFFITTSICWLARVLTTTAFSGSGGRTTNVAHPRLGSESGERISLFCPRLLA